MSENTTGVIHDRSMAKAAKADAALKVPEEIGVNGTHDQLVTDLLYDEDPRSLVLWRKDVGQTNTPVGGQVEKHREAGGRDDVGAFMDVRQIGALDFALDHIRHADMSEIEVFENRFCVFSVPGRNRPGKALH
ncbi:hypothetical protein [Roseobacter sinensis]|uniref:Uncharacterized protein n=1 Tax=Roseobacter sinensis TaxID=2931391 RepID=A0ABT3BIJ5_9RHOB|nr:hypothetical protein [Roseobacter sp. WL0113]MCV3273391.1 hypothetical protein [Roseobacter sp. WL0113]